MQKGHRVNQARGLISLGLFKDYDDIRNSPVQDFDGYKVMPGDIKYKDVNGDGKIDGNDQVAIGATTKPNLIYGFGIAANWKGLDVNLHFQGAGKSTYFIDGSTVHMFKLGDGWEMSCQRWLIPIVGFQQIYLVIQLQRIRMLNIPDYPTDLILITISNLLIGYATGLIYV